MLFLDLAQECAPQIAAETLAAVVSVESGFKPYAIRINSDHPLAEQPGTRAEAIATATILIAEGHDVDLGLAGINSGDLGRLGLSVSDSFDVCLNMKTSATLLEGYYRVALEGGATSAQAETIMLHSWYGRGDAKLGELVRFEETVTAARKHLADGIGSIKIGETASSAPATPDGAGEGTTLAAGATNPKPAVDRPIDTIPHWDVFNPARRSSVLVFSYEHKE